MKRRYLLLIVLVLALAAWWWYSRNRAEVAQREDPALIFNRMWIDSTQRKDTDFVNVMVMVTQVPIGVFQHSSSYRYTGERFDYRRKDKRINLHFPQSDREAELTYRVWRCKDLPPYDLCLELSANPWENGPRRYYGMREQRRASAWHLALRRRVMADLQ